MPVLVVVFVGISSFGLGRLSMLEEERQPIIIREAVWREGVPLARGGMFVGSKKGQAYHFPWCPGALTINDANKRWFATEADAHAAGYTPAKNCPGLMHE